MVPGVPVVTARADVSVLVPLPEELWFNTPSGDVTITVTSVRVGPRITTWAGPVVSRGRRSAVEESSVTAEPGYRPAGCSDAAWLYASRLRSLVVTHTDRIVANVAALSPHG